MKITVFSHYFAPEIGAPSARIHDMAREWIGLGHEVQVVTCFPNHPVGQIYPGYKARGYDCETLDGIKVHRHWTYVTPNKDFLKKTLGHVSYWPSSAWNSEVRLTPTDVSIGTSPTFFAAMASRRAARRHRAPHIMEVRDLWPAILVELGVLKNRFLVRLLEKWEMALYREAFRVVTVTEAFRQNLLERGIPAEKVESIPNGADAAFWRPMSRPQPLARSLGLEGKFVVLYIGAHGISQGLSQTLDSAGLLRGQPKIRFLFVGDGAQKELLVKRASSSGLDNVIFRGPVEKETVREYYALADVCLAPLRDIDLFQSFIPSKIFEMLAMARPVIASLRGEAAEILNRSGGSKVTAPEDPASVAEAIGEMAARPELCEQMGRAGRAFVTAHYSRSVLALKYLSLLEAAVREQRMKQG